MSFSHDEIVESIDPLRKGSIAKHIGGGDHWIEQNIKSGNKREHLWGKSKVTF